MSTSLACTALFFLMAGQPTDNSWKARVPAAVKAARLENSVAAYQKALERAWRADAWQAGLELARETLDQWPDSEPLRGAQARALWRAGQLALAEELASKISPTGSDPIALRTLIQIELARAGLSTASAAAQRLSELTPLSAEDLFAIVGTRLAQNQLADLPELLRQTQTLANVANGYPENYIVEQLQGLPEFFQAIGSAPLNQIARFGEVDMPVIQLINLPSCQAMINGRGPYTLMVDTGGSITLSLDESVAAELGLKSISRSTIHGVGGREESGQTLVDELTFGGITCKRVMTHTFPLRKSIAYAADGVLGTGIFGDARMTLDFAAGRLRLAPASTEPAPGAAAHVRIVGDGKLLIPAQVNDRSLVALIDSGADVFALSASSLQKLFPNRDIKTFSAVALGVGADAQPSISTMPSVRLELPGRTLPEYGGVGLDVFDTLLSPMLGIQTDVLVGMPLLRETRAVTVDFAHCRMWIDWLNR